jgi:hypothetical protein
MIARWANSASTTGTPGQRPERLDANLGTPEIIPRTDQRAAAYESDSEFLLVTPAAKDDNMTAGAQESLLRRFVYSGVLL